MDDPKRYHDWWERRDGVDLWSIPHFLFGVLMALAPPFLLISFYTALVLTVIVSILWEWLEIYAEVHESLANRIFDVAFHIFGFLLLSTFLAKYPQDQGTLSVFGLIVLIAYGIMNFLGWLAYRRRKRASTQL